MNPRLQSLARRLAILPIAVAHFGGNAAFADQGDPHGGGGTSNGPVTPASEGNRVLIQENFDATTGGLAGRLPAVNLISPGTAWVADPIFAADGRIDDGGNTDRGAWLDLGPGFTFAENETYTLDLAWTNLNNAILFAGFMATAPDPGAQMQTQSGNLALRARLINAGTDKLGAWRNPGAAFVAGSSATPSTGGTTLSLATRGPGDATFTVDGASQPVDLTAGYRYLWIGYEDPTSGTSDARLVSLVLNGPAPASQPDPPVASILPETSLVPAGQLITLGATPPADEIRYTTDGSVPDAHSALYTAPFPLEESATIRAVAILGSIAGPVVSRTYFAREPIGTPNLLIVVGHEIGFGDLQCNGGTTIATPTLDSLAHDGVRFTQFTTTGPGKLASQYALLTGRVAARSGLAESVAAGASGWQAEEWTLAESLRRRGYSTAFVGEWLLGSGAGSHPNDQGFQLFHGLPHDLDAGPPLVENRQTVDPGPDPALLLDQLATRAGNFIASATEPFAIVFQAPAPPAAGDSLAGAHGNRVEALDQATARLLAALETRGVAPDTLVVFMGDGGAPRTADGGSNGLFRDGSGTTWEGGMRTPLIARLPGTLPSGQMNLSLLWLPDLMPTFASLLGSDLATDRPLDGTPRPAVLAGSRTRPAGDETAFGFRYHDNAYRLATVRRGKWKSHLSIVNIDPQNTNATTGNPLYDLHVDAEERINRANQQAVTLGQLQDLADALESGLPPAGTTDLPDPKQAILDGVSVTLDGSASTLAARFAFARPVDSLDDNYHLEHSDDLLSWLRLSITSFLTSRTPVGESGEELELLVPLGAAPLDGVRRFVRVRAERPANP